MLIKEIKSKEDLQSFLINYEKENGQRSLHRCIQNSKTLKLLIESFTPDEIDLSTSARSELIIKNTDRPTCIICGSKTNFEKNNRRFLECCSVKCAANNESRINKIKNTNFEKYGNENFWGSKMHQDNLKDIAIKNFGVDHYMKSEDFKEKSEKTSLEKYGTKKPQQSDEVKIKIKESSLKIDRKLIEINRKLKSIKKYGVDHHMKVYEIFEKQQKSSFYRKDYILPSGRKIQLQGFEPKCLDELLLKYKEDDILMTSKEIFSVLGPIDYYDIDGKQRRYFPDFYIVSENKIIEVKSDRTFNVHKELNLSKRKECINRGYNFEFWIYSNNGLEIII